MAKKYFCTECGQQYNPFDPRKPGPFGLCAICGRSEETEEPKMAKVSWEGKHTPIIEITDAESARKFNRLQRRIGAGPLASIVEPKESHTAANYGKRGSGAEDHAQYTSRLREKRTVKL